MLWCDHWKHTLTIFLGSTNNGPSYVITWKERESPLWLLTSFPISTLILETWCANSRVFRWFVYCVTVSSVQSNGQTCRWSWKCPQCILGPHALILWSLGWGCVACSGDSEDHPQSKIGSWLWIVSFQAARTILVVRSVEQICSHKCVSQSEARPQESLAIQQLLWPTSLASLFFLFFYF